MESIRQDIRFALRPALVGVQVAVTCVLLFSTTMFGRALQTMRSLRPQWNVENVVVTSLDLELNGTTADGGMSFQHDVRNRVSALPGVESAAWATTLPIGGQSRIGPMNPLGGEAAPAGTNLYGSFNRVSPGFFRTMQIPLMRGRDFSDADRADAPRVAIFNESMAISLFGTADAVGRRFSIGAGEFLREHEVVGVRDLLDVYLLPQRLSSWVAAVMGAFGLILAAVGIYGVAAFAASRRSKEIAIRLALGATDRDVTRLLVGRGARAPLVGMVVGLLAGLGRPWARRPWFRESRLEIRCR